MNTCKYEDRLAIIWRVDVMSDASSISLIKIVTLRLDVRMRSLLITV
jgi:hypothetical protein